MWGFPGDSFQFSQAPEASPVNGDILLREQRQRTPSFPARTEALTVPELGCWRPVPSGVVFPQTCLQMKALPHRGPCLLSSGSAHKHWSAWGTPKGHPSRRALCGTDRGPSDRDTAQLGFCWVLLPSLPAGVDQRPCLNKLPAGEPLCQSPYPRDGGQ